MSSPNRHSGTNQTRAGRYGAVHRYPLGGGFSRTRIGARLAGALDQFPLLMAKLLEQYGEELRAKLLDELGQGQWIDQEHSVLGRNKHIRACRRLIREDSPDVHCQDGRGLLRLLRESGKPPEPVPPPAMTPVPAMPLAKAEPESDVEDETGIYASGWLERMRGQGWAAPARTT